MPKYLIVGNGYLGGRFAQSLEGAVLYPGKVASGEEAKALLLQYQPETLINCAGKTGKPNVDWCESHKQETVFGNINLPLFLAQASQEAHIPMVHLGSGCVYEGNPNGAGFKESDLPNFSGSFYSRTKSASESLLAAYPHVLQIRIRMPLDTLPGSRNLLDKLLGYKRIINTPNSLTAIPDLLEITSELMQRGAKGIYNVVNRGGITHEEILALYARISGEKLDYTLIDASTLDKITLARRSNCVLSTRKLESLGVRVPEVHEATTRCITEYVQNKRRGIAS